MTNLTRHSADLFRSQPPPPCCTTTSRTSWKEVAAHYPNPQQCLTAFLAFGAAEVLAGVKPANLLLVSNKTCACGRNMYDLWQRFAPQCLADSALVAQSMRCDERGELFLLYHPQLLQRRLDSRSARAFLRALGYPTPQLLAPTLLQLRRGFNRESLPHEVGLFLGYPLKDVAGFMGRTPLPVSSQRLWKIYGRSRRSEQLADLYQHKHQLMVDYLCRQRGQLLSLQPQREMIHVG